jgi:hypothetical protein
MASSLTVIIMVSSGFLVWGVGASKALVYSKTI